MTHKHSHSSATTMSKWNDYGAAHKQRRALFTPFVQQGLCVCPYCAKPIQPGQRWALGHNTNRTDSVPWHTVCNQQDAQAKAAKTRSHRRPQQERHPGLKPGANNP